ncbi:MAG: L-threonylcarbamoyladenylate synthase [Lachnospiraceae bacterium]
MDTIIKNADEGMDVIRIGGQILRNGGLVAFPTETVYGLGGNALDPNASKKIYAAKGRPSDNPLIVHVADRETIYQLTASVTEIATKLMDAFWPGPLTLILKKSKIVPYETTGGLDTVAIRFPNHPTALSLIKEACVPVAAPSANTSGRPSPTLAKHVIEDLSDKIDMIIDDGPVGIGVESTIIDVTEEVPVILRPGYITKEMVEKVIGNVKIDHAVNNQVKEGEHPKAPGMKYRHYAPKASLTLVEGELDTVIGTINSLAAIEMNNGKKVGIICTEETKNRYKAGAVKSIGSRTSQESIAHNLYALLRDFDQEGVDEIFSESFQERQLGMAIMNRLTKAAGHKILYV